MPTPLKGPIKTRLGRHERGPAPPFSATHEHSEVNDVGCRPRPPFWVSAFIEILSRTPARVTP